MEGFQYFIFRTRETHPALRAPLHGRGMSDAMLYTIYNIYKY
jgi:hypothetical protein